MIEARKSDWFCWWFSRNAEGRIRRAFDQVRVRGLEALRAELARGPVLAVSNHTAWWDPLVSLVLSHRVLGADAFAMMDAANLRRLPFFAKVGAFGVALEDPADGARAIRYASKRLDRPGRLVWVFAQGREVPVTARPLRFEAGGALIARVARGAVVVPIGIRYEHGEAPEPSLWLSIGSPLSRAPGDRPPLSEACRAQENAVAGELERIERALVEGANEDFAVLFRKRERPWGKAAETLLAWMTRPPARL